MNIKFPTNPSIYYIIVGASLAFLSGVFSRSYIANWITILTGMAGFFMFLFGMGGLHKSQKLKDNHQELINKKLQEEIEEIRIRTSWIESEPNSLLFSKSRRGLG